MRLTTQCIGASGLERCPRDTDDEGGMFCYQHKCYEMPEDNTKVIVGEVVYFIVAPIVELVKIGKTTNLKFRLNTLKTMSPVPLELARSIEGPVGSEVSLHKRYAEHRQHGEWFTVEGQLESDILFALDEELCSHIKGYADWMSNGRFNNPTWRWWALSQASHLRLIPLAQRKPWECEPWQAAREVALNGT